MDDILVDHQGVTSPPLLRKPKITEEQPSVSAVPVTQPQQGPELKYGTWYSEYKEFFTKEYEDEDIPSEAWKEYTKQVVESDGFDLDPDIVPMACDIGIRCPLNLTKCCPDYLVKWSKVALAEYNEREKTKLKFVEIVSVILEPCGIVTYYITLKATDNGGQTKKTIQGRVWVGVNDEYKVELVRENPQRLS